MKMSILVWVIILIAVVVSIKKGSAPAKAKKQPPSEKPCPNPEQHRHYETAKPCPNPEKHRHYEAPKQYDTFAQPAQQAKSDTARRLENVKRLYEAGLLTREEYDQEVRRYKQGAPR